MDGWPEEPLTTGEICISQPGSCCKPNQTGSRFGFASVPRDIRHVRTNCSCAETAYLADKIGLSFFKKITWYQSKSKNISIIISNFRTLDTRFARMHAKHLQERSYRFPGSRSAAAVTSGLETGSHVLRIAKGQGPRAKGQGAGSAGCAALPKRPVAHAGLESGCRTWPDLLHRTIERAARRPSGDEMMRSVPIALKNSYFAKASHALLLQEGFSRAGCPLVRARLRLKPARAELHSGYRQKLPT